MSTKNTPPRFNYFTCGYLVLISHNTADLWTSCDADAGDLQMAFVEEFVTWEDAERACQQSLGHLATIRNTSQVDCAVRAMANNPAATCVNNTCDRVHVGLVRMNFTSNYRWVGSLNVIEPSSSSLWLPGQGTADDECGFWQNSTNRIGNNPCSTKRLFICQRQRQAGKALLILKVFKIYDINTNTAYHRKQTSMASVRKAIFHSGYFSKCKHQTNRT